VGGRLAGGHGRRGSRRRRGGLLIQTFSGERGGEGEKKRRGERKNFWRQLAVDDDRQRREGNLVEKNPREPQYCDTSGSRRLSLSPSTHHVAEDVADAADGKALRFDAVTHSLIGFGVPGQHLLQIGEESFDEIRGQGGASLALHQLLLLLQERPVEEPVEHLQRADVAALRVEQLWKEKKETVVVGGIVVVGECGPPFRGIAVAEIKGAGHAKVAPIAKETASPPAVRDRRPPRQE